MSGLLKTERVPGLSDKAMEAAREATKNYVAKEAVYFSVNDALDAAYPIIRADVIAEVVDAVRRSRGNWLWKDAAIPVADFIEQEFGKVCDHDCDHDWVDARNEVVASGEYCSKCRAVRAGNEATA